MNAFRADRTALISALATAGYEVDDSQPEVIDPGTILLDSVSYEWGDTFGQVEATYTAHVVLDAFDAVSASLAHVDAVAAIWKALSDSGAADIETAGPLTNMSDAAGNIFPAFTLTITSTITY